MALLAGSSLLQRYNLTVDQLDYTFVRSCEDSATLERILHVLRSGQEGSYPHLLRFTEECLAKVCPQSRKLWAPNPPTRPCDLPPEQLASLEEEMAAWSAEVKDREKELTRLEFIRAPLPPVRGSNLTDPEMALKGRSCVTKLSTSKLQSLLTKGRQYFVDRDFLQASLQYQKVLESSPMNPEALQGMADIQDQAEGRGTKRHPLIQEIS